VPGRWWGVAAAAWTLAYVLLYVAVVRSQGNEVAWWYVGLLWVASALAAAAPSTRRTRLFLGVAAVLYGIGALLGLLTIGVLLVPAVVACLLGMRPSRRQAA
jgi:hypothetical protein